MNSVQLTGRLTRDPEDRYTDNGHTIARFTLAVDRQYKSDNGPTADFINCKAFGKTAEFIEKYFETYPKIKGFLDGLVKDGKEHGYVTTMFGRRRPVPELKSSNFMQRSFGERVAMNSPIQGTAADIIKIAMNHVYERMKKEGLHSRLVLQVHDELLIETKKEEIEIVSRILEEEMKGAADLAVELDVDMHQGDSWYEAK